MFNHLMITKGQATELESSSTDMGKLDLNQLATPMPCDHDSRPPGRRQQPAIDPLIHRKQSEKHHTTRAMPSQISTVMKHPTDDPFRCHLQPPGEPKGSKENHAS